MRAESPVHSNDGGDGQGDGLPHDPEHVAAAVVFHRQGRGLGNRDSLLVVGSRLAGRQGRNDSQKDQQGNGSHGWGIC